jgi:hypothetical protein
MVASNWGLTRWRREWPKGGWEGGRAGVGPDCASAHGARQPSKRSWVVKSANPAVSIEPPPGSGSTPHRSSAYITPTHHTHTHRPNTHHQQHTPNPYLHRTTGSDVGRQAAVQDADSVMAKELAHKPQAGGGEHPHRVVTHHRVRVPHAQPRHLVVELLQGRLHKPHAARRDAPTHPTHTPPNTH